MLCFVNNKLYRTIQLSAFQNDPKLVLLSLAFNEFIATIKCLRITSAIIYFNRFINIFMSVHFLA